MKQILPMMDNFNSKERSQINIDPTQKQLLCSEDINGTLVFHNKLILNTEKLEKSFRKSIQKPGSFRRTFMLYKNVFFFFSIHSTCSKMLLENQKLLNQLTFTKRLLAINVSAFINWNYSPKCTHYSVQYWFWRLLKGTF